MKGYLLVFACVLNFAAVAVRAEEGDPQPIGVKFGARGTIGTGGYKGRNGYLQYGDAWRVRGSYADYDYDGSTGTTRTIGLRASYQGDSLSVGLNASVTPRNDNYANRAFGADGAWTFLLNEGSEEPGGLEEFELGAFWSQTRHSQIIPGNAALEERDVNLNQHDLGISAAVTAWDLTLSLDASRSIYDKDFSQLPNASLRFRRLTEAASLVNGFPERAGSARLEYGRWRACIPYISAAATRYSIQPQPASLTSGAGVALKYGGLGVDLGYELVRQKGSADTKYFNFGGSFKF